MPPGWPWCLATTAALDGPVWGILYLIPTLMCDFCVESVVVGNGLVYQHRTNPDYQDLWCKLDIDSDNLDSYTDKHDDWNLVFAHHEEEDKIYPLTLTEIADALHKDQELKVYYKKNAKMPQKDTCFHLNEDTKVLCKNGKLIIPTSLRHRAVSW
jgi:hypothetical protein